MSASAKSLSAVALAFVAGMASMSAYMSRGVARRDVPEAPQRAAPSLAERLRAEAHGQSLPWSDPVETTSVPSSPPKLQFTPGPAGASADGIKSAPGGEGNPVQQVMPAPTSVRPPDEDRDRPRFRIAERNRSARPGPNVAPGVERTRPGSLETSRRTLDEEGGHSQARSAAATHPTAKPHPAPSRNLPSLDAVDEARFAARRPEPSRARSPAPSPYRTVRLARREDLDGDAPPPARATEAHADAPGWPSGEESRAKPRRSFAASDGLMRWLSGPGGRF